MTVAETLADFLVGTRYEDLPHQAVDHAAMIVASTLASAAPGREIDSARIVRAIEQERGGTPEASVWYDAGPKLPVVGAARANALMSDAAASDDSDLRNIVHAGTPVTATALAVAEKMGASGKDMLAAIVCGYELAGRMGEAIIPRFDYRGFHGCMGATFAATGAAARLYGLNAGQAAHAIVLTATSIGGITRSADTSVAREYHAGNATMLGIEAVLAARRGYTGELQLLEMGRGFCELIRGDRDGIDGLTQDLGKDWDIVTDMAIKMMPGAHPYHAIAEAAANAAREGRIDPAKIAAVFVSRPNQKALPGPVHPKDLVDMAHSAAFFAAAGICDGHLGWAHATPEKIADPAIHAVCDRVRGGPEIAGDLSAYRQGASVSIETTDGRAVTSTVHIPNGAGCRGIAWADIEVKYRALGPAAMTGVQVEKSLAAIRGLPEAADVSDLIGTLRPS